MLPVYNRHEDTQLYVHDGGRGGLPGFEPLRTQALEPAVDARVQAAYPPGI